MVDPLGFIEQTKQQISCPPEPHVLVNNSLFPLLEIQSSQLRKMDTEAVLRSGINKSLQIR